MSETKQAMRGAPPVRTWQRWAAYRSILGDEQLEKIYRVGLRMLQRYSADPDFAESAERNPDDRHRAVLRLLMERGRVELARQVVSDDAALVGCELRSLDEVAPDRSDLRDEMLDDLPALALFHDSMRTREPHVSVCRAYRKAVRELKETFSLYCRDSGLCIEERDAHE